MSGYDVLQTGVYEALIAAPDLVDLLATYLTAPAIFEEAPQAADGASLLEFPYITIGNNVTVPFDTDTETGSESVFQVDVWSRTKNNEECNMIMDEVYNALHRQELTLIGKHFVGCDLESSSITTDPDGITRHGVQRYLIRFED